MLIGKVQDAEKCNLYDTVVFEGPPKTEQTLWPRHCVQESWGAELHKDLKVRSKPGNLSTDIAGQKTLLQLD